MRLDTLTRRSPRAVLLGTTFLLSLAAACTPPVPAPTPVAVASFEVSPARVARGAKVTIAWSITGDVADIQLLRGLDVIEQPTEPTGSLEVGSLPVGRQTFELKVRGAGGDEVSRSGTVEVFAPPTIAAFTASRTTVPRGSTVTLSWRTAGAETVVVSTTSGHVVDVTGDAAAEGTVDVTLDETTAYSLTASGVGGQVQATATVEVLPEPAITAFDSSPARVLAGQPVTLSWTTTNAAALSIKVGDRTIFNASPAIVATGTRTVTPTADTSYEAVAVGPGGTATRTVLVGVIPQPRVARFVAEPAEVIAGNSTSLRWELAGVDEVTLTADGAPVDIGSAGPTGSLDVTPAATTIYEITGRGEGGTTSATLVVTVIGVPAIDSFVTDKTFLYRNRESARLSWTARNATVASIADADGALVDLGSADPNAGSVVVSPAATTNYTLTITGPGGTASALLESPITVDDPLPGVTLTSALSQVILGQTTEISWRVTDATSFTITRRAEGETTDSPVDITGKSFDDVLTLEPPTVDVTYTLHAIGQRPELTAEASVSIRVVRLPTFTTFTSDKIRTTAAGGQEVLLTEGASHTLTWETRDATDVRFDNVALTGVPGTFRRVRGNPAAVPLPTPSSFDDAKMTLNFPDGFAFTWFGTQYTSTVVSTNGWMCFGTGCDGTSSYLTAAYGTAVPNNLIAPFWRDLKTLSTDNSFNYLIEGTAPNRVLTIEWGEMGIYDSSFTDSIDTEAGRVYFQVVLYEDGRWEIRHETRPPLTAPATTNAIERYASTASIGYEGPGGVPAVQYSTSTTVGLCGRVLTTTDPACPNQANIIKPLALEPSGSIQIRGEATSCLQMVATGPVGTTRSPCIVVRTVPATTVNYFGAVRLPSSDARAASLDSGAGESVRLDYDVGPATTGVIKSYGIRNRTTGNLEAGTNTIAGQIVVAPTETTTYTVFAKNEAGDEASSDVTVNIGPPRGTFAVTPASGQVGDPFTFNWTTTGARTVALKAPSGAVVGRQYSWDQTTDQSSIKAGTATANLTESGTYTLEVTNGSGTTRLTVPIEIVPELRIVSFTAASSEQTAEAAAQLSWDVLNATSVSVAVRRTSGDPPVTTDTPLPAMPITDTRVRRGVVSGIMDSTDTTFVLTAANASGTQQRTVTVASVPKPRVTAFSADTPTIPFGGSATLTWATSDATTLQMFTLGRRPDPTTANPNPEAPVLGEITNVRDQLTGSLTVSPVRTTGYRIVAQNRLGASVQRDLDPVLTVDQQPPQLSQFDVIPGDFIPNGGQAELVWNSAQAENVYLWMRHYTPATGAPASPDLATDAQDPLQVPYDYKPYEFEDISGTGTALVMGWGATLTAVATPANEDIDNGYNILTLPADFRPHFFGEDVGRVLVSTDGSLFLAPAGAADTYFDGGGASVSTSTTSCRVTTSTSACGTSTSTTAISTNTSTTPSSRLHVFHANLAGCNSNTGGLTTGCPTGRTPGKIYWEIRGTAPSRRLVVQWDRWDASGTTAPGEYTFQAKLYENGDVEYQYKRLQAVTNTAFARGGSAIVGIERRAYKGFGANYFLALSQAAQNLNPGDGWIMYSGRRPASGRLRTFAKVTKSITIPASGSNPAVTTTNFPFRAVATNSRDTDNRVTILRTPQQGLGQNDLFLSELMIDPDAADDTRKEWIEVRNIRTSAAQLANFTLQTSSGSFQIPGGTVPASGFVVLGQSNVTAENGGVNNVSVAYGTGLQLDDVADSVILRVGNALIDRVEYDGTAGWRIPSGRSLAYGATPANHVDNDVIDNWCAGRDPANASAKATPGAANPSCYGFEVVPYDPAWDISAATGVTVIASGAIDDSYYTATLGIPYTHFGDTYASGSSFTVSSNGWISLGTLATTSAASNSTLPYISTLVPGDLIAPYWDDGKGTASGRMITKVVGTAPNRAQVIMWDLWGAPYTAPPPGKFGVALLESGNPVLFYIDLAGMNGSSATVGVEAKRKSLSFLFSYNTAFTGVTTPVGLRPRKFD